ncbi:MAG: FAD-dependent oxidoreductase, partial [Synergistaceae bacterium]|nr:FAD-dependent oxidoreductase [Synergistaceae bacterium]
MSEDKIINIIGGGLAGSEAAWQIAARDNNIRVKLYEMRPHDMTPAHKTENLAEVVCSNSLGSENNLEQNKISASGILKEELKLGNSLILNCAENS